MTAYQFALALQKYHKGWGILYNSKGKLREEWIDAAKNNKEKAVEMLKQYSK